MSDQPRIDPERLAALVDGRLDPRAREALLRELSGSDESAEALAELAQVLADLERDEEPSSDDARIAAAPPLPRAEVPLHAAPYATRPSRLRTSWPALAAAVLVLAAGIGVTLQSATRDGAGSVTRDMLGSTPGALLAALSLPSDATVSAASTVSALPPTRGDRVPTSDERARAVRVGAQLLALQLAARQQDTVGSRLARAVADELAQVPGGAAAAPIYHDLAHARTVPPESLATLLTLGWQASNAVLDEKLLRIGAWLAAARVAAGRRDDAFFRSRVSRVSAELLAEWPQLPPRSRAAAARVRSAADETAKSWGELEQDVTDLYLLLGTAAPTPP